MRQVFLALVILGSLGAQAPAPSADPFAAVRFLEGEWQGEGGGLPGQPEASLPIWKESPAR